MSPDYRAALFLMSLSLVAWGLRQMGGRMAPRMAMAPLVFLTTRWPVLVVWVIGSVGWFVFLRQSLLPGKEMDLFTMIGLSLMCGLGVAALTVGPLWMLYALFHLVPELGLEPGETLQLELKANHMLGLEARGGTLWITDRRLLFRPHRFNVQRNLWSVARHDIVSGRAEGQRLLVLETTAGQELLVVPQPAELLQRIVD